jgi:SecD/SecF fusion protein
MRNKTGIIVLSVIVGVLCLFYLSLTLISRGVQREAQTFATDPETGIVDERRKQAYLDSVWTEPVFNFLGASYTYQQVKESELGLGLDLKGGMHVTLEVSPIEIIRSLSGNSKDPGFLKALDRAQEMQRRSQDNFVNLFYQSYREVEPQGRLSAIFTNAANKGRISYESTDADVLRVINDEVDDAIARSFNILRTRIDRFGVTQPNIQRLQGTGRIQIELPGVDNPDRVRKLLSGMAKLEFWEVWSPNEFGPYLSQLNDYLVREEAATKVASPSAGTAVQQDDVLARAAAPAAGDTASLAQQLEAGEAAADPSVADTLGMQQSSQLARLFTQLPGGIGSNVRDTARVNALLRKPEVRGIFPPNMQFVWSVKPIRGANNQDFVELHAIKKGRDGRAPVTGEFISDATQDFDQGGRPEVSMAMNLAGAKKWQRLTADNIGRQVAIVLDGYVYSAPVVQNEISGGRSSITGNFTIDEAKDLANILKAGKMPAPTRIVEEAIVGPSLGQEAINQGLLSTLAGLVLVVIFMVAYYSKGGLIANVALLLNVFFILGVLAQLGAALTLPGIAGIVLTLGMAVDANVLIFERIKEELAHGLTLRDAIRKGYDKAFSSIFDANVTTLLAGTILYFFGSGPVQGFAITLMIGIATSFFTAVFITRVIIEAMTKNQKGTEGFSFVTGLSGNLFKNVKFDVFKYKKPAYILSSFLIVFGFVAMALQGGPNLGVDFTGGRSYVVDFDRTVPASEVRAALSDDFVGAGTEVKTFGASNRLKIITSYLVNDESIEADETVKAALVAGLEQYSELNPTIVSQAKVGATMADDIQDTAIIAIILSLIGIFIYVMIRFDRWQFSLGGVVAIFHDALMVISFFSIARLFGVVYEIDQVFIAAILTIIGFSINDTVVIFDRIREYLHDNTRLGLKDVVNPALISTFSRTIITSLTVFVVALVLFLFGGEVLRGFSFALLVGIISGTYSSLFIAVPVVIDTTPDKTPAPAPVTSPRGTLAPKAR